METKPKEKERKKKGKWKRVEKEEKRGNMKENIEWKYWMKDVRSQIIDKETKKECRDRKKFK